MNLQATFLYGKPVIFNESYGRECANITAYGYLLTFSFNFKLNIYFKK